MGDGISHGDDCSSIGNLLKDGRLEPMDSTECFAHDLYQPLNRQTPQPIFVIGITHVHRSSTISEAADKASASAARVSGRIDLPGTSLNFLPKECLANGESLHEVHLATE